MITLNTIFRNDMIMQAEKPIRLFGTGVGKVTASCDGNTASAENVNGRFVLELPGKNYGDTADITVSDDEGSVVLKNVLFGDVYLFAGQSNMAFQVVEAVPDGEIFESDDIRLFFSKDFFFDSRGWYPLTSGTARNLSALAYFSVRDSYREKKRPVGIITAHQGASVIQSWMSPEALKELNINLLDSELAGEHTNPAYIGFNKDSTLYGWGIEHLMPASLAGVIWYQGESNTAGEARVYDKFLTKLITSWRSSFMDENLPFVIIQIADFEGRDIPEWHEVQEKQKYVCDTVPNCRLVISRDVCETGDIHPPTKHLLARRIAELL